MGNKLHSSHVTRVSLDSSSYDEYCINCGRTDITAGNWGKLSKPCPLLDKDSIVLNVLIDEAEAAVTEATIDIALRAYENATVYGYTVTVREGIRAALEAVGVI